MTAFANCAVIWLPLLGLVTSARHVHQRRIITIPTRRASGGDTSKEAKGAAGDSFTTPTVGPLFVFGEAKNAHRALTGQRTPIPSTSRSRRDTQPDKPTYDSAAQAAAAATGQVDGYKPREERSWEEFHPDLDIESKITAFSAIDVDGVHQESQNNAAVDQQLYDGSATKSLEGLLPNGIRPRSSDMMPTLTPTPRRRPGRPPRRPEAMLYGLGSPPAPKIIPLPAQNPRERLNLPKPSYRKIATFAAYEADRAVQVNYVDRTMANAGFQESEMYLRSDRKFIRLEEESPPEGAGASLMLETEKDQMSSMNLPPFTRVEYDMDEQDGQWLDAQNLIRKDEQVEAIKPGIFEITMTQIEKEWHALEKSESATVEHYVSPICCLRSAFPRNS